MWLLFLLIRVSCPRAACDGDDRCKTVRGRSSDHPEPRAPWIDNVRGLRCRTDIVQLHAMTKRENRIDEDTLSRKQLFSGAYKYQRWPWRDAMSRCSQVSALGPSSDIYSRRDESGELECKATPVYSSGYATPSAAFQSRPTPILWHFSANDHKSISRPLSWATDQQHTHERGP
jgi:hypothetical protein